jgi:hypothetical protein
MGEINLMERREELQKIIRGCGFRGRSLTIISAECRVFNRLGVRLGQRRPDPKCEKKIRKVSFIFIISTESFNKWFEMSQL